MPYIKKSPPPYAAMTRLIKSYGYNGLTLAQVLGVSSPTAKKKLERPETLTLADLDRINRFGHIPLDELREAITR